MKPFFSTLCTLLLVLFVVTSCDFGSLKPKPIPKDKQDYIGTWTSAEVLLQISADGQLNYEYHSGNSTTTINGPIQKFNGNDFEAGALGINKTFKVKQAPHQENGKWVMVVEGQKLTRQ